MGKEVNFGKLLHGGDYNPERRNRCDPVAWPREITAGCGLSWKAAPEEGKEILAALQTAGLAYEAEYRVLL